MNGDKVTFKTPYLGQEMYKKVNDTYFGGKTLLLFMVLQKFVWKSIFNIGVLGALFNTYQ